MKGSSPWATPADDLLVSEERIDWIGVANRMTRMEWFTLAMVMVVFMATAAQGFAMIIMWSLSLIGV